jgi:hypothetical protein
MKLGQNKKLLTKQDSELFTERKVIEQIEFSQKNKTYNS